MGCVWMKYIPKISKGTKWSNSTHVTACELVLAYTTWFRPPNFINFQWPWWTLVPLTSIDLHHMLIHWCTIWSICTIVPLRFNWALHMHCASGHGCGVVGGPCGVSPNLIRLFNMFNISYISIHSIPFHSYIPCSPMYTIQIYTIYTSNIQFIFLYYLYIYSFYYSIYSIFHIFSYFHIFIIWFIYFICHLFHIFQYIQYIHVFHLHVYIIYRYIYII